MKSGEIIEGGEWSESANGRDVFNLFPSLVSERVFKTMAWEEYGAMPLESVSTFDGDDNSSEGAGHRLSESLIGITGLDPQRCKNFSVNDPEYAGE